MDPKLFDQMPAYQVLNAKGELLTNEEDVQVIFFSIHNCENTRFFYKNSFYKNIRVKIA